MARDVLNVLIIYGTTEGQTRKISEWMAAHIRERGYQTELYDSAALIFDFDLEKGLIKPEHAKSAKMGKEEGTHPGNVGETPAVEFREDPGSIDS